MTRRIVYTAALVALLTAGEAYAQTPAPSVDCSLLTPHPLGDGLVAPTIVRGDDLRDVVALKFQPVKAGTFDLQVRATDACGRGGATGLRREVVVQ